MPSPQVTEHCDTPNAHKHTHKYVLFSSAFIENTEKKKKKKKILSHLRPCPCPPLGRTYSMVAGSPYLWTFISAVFAVDHFVGTIVKRLHALHHPGLVPEFSTGLTARTPLFYHPPIKRALCLNKTIPLIPKLNNLSTLVFTSSLKW